MENKNIKRLEDIADIISGVPLNRYKKDDNLKEQIVIQQRSVNKNKKEIHTEKEELSTKINKRYYTKKNDIIYKLQGDTLAKLINNEEGAIVTHSFAIIRPNKNKEEYNPSFITNLLNDPVVNNQIMRLTDGTVIPKVSINVLKELQLVIPPIEIQNEYSNILQLINKRIEIYQDNINKSNELKEAIFEKLIGDIYE